MIFAILSILALLPALPANCADPLCGIFVVLLGTPWFNLLSFLPDSVLERDFGMLFLITPLVINFFLLILLGRFLARRRAQR